MKRSLKKKLRKAENACHEANNRNGWNYNNEQISVISRALVAMAQIKAKG